MAANKAAAQSWRAAIPIHPYAEMLPTLSAAELAELGQDIKANGLRNPATLLREGDRVRLIDGRSRFDAAEGAGVPVVDGAGKLLLPHEIIEATDGFDVAAFVISQNLRRRHLTATQRRKLTGELLRADPLRSDRATARLVGIDNKTVAAVRTELERREEIPHAETRADTQGRQQPATKPATRQRNKPQAREVAEILVPPQPEPSVVAEQGATETRPAATADDATPEAQGAAVRIADIAADVSLAGFAIVDRLIALRGEPGASLAFHFTYAIEEALRQRAPGVVPPVDPAYARVPGDAVRIADIVTDPSATGRRIGEAIIQANRDNLEQVPTIATKLAQAIDGALRDALPKRFLLPRERQASQPAPEATATEAAEPEMRPAPKPGRKKVDLSPEATGTTAADGLRRAIEVAGTRPALARALGFSAQAIDQWVKAGRIPKGRIDKVAEVTDLPPEVLRPDLFPGEPA